MQQKLQTKKSKEYIQKNPENVKKSKKNPKILFFFLLQQFLSLNLTVQCLVSSKQYNK